MATYYADSAFSTNTTQGITAGAVVTTTAYVFRHQVPTEVGKPVKYRCSFNLANASGQFKASSSDTLILGYLPKGVSLERVEILPQADLDTDSNFTFNLGVTGSLTALASASTALQAAITTPTILTPTGTLTSSNDTTFIILSAQANELNASGTVIFDVVLTAV